MSELQNEPSLDPSRQETASRYARLRRQLFAVDFGLTVLLLALLAFSGLSRQLTSWLSLSDVPGAVIYLAIMLAGYSALTAPLDYYAGFVLPHRYGLSVESLRGWLADQLKGRGLGLALAAGLVAAVYLFMGSFPGFWWLLAWGLIFVAGIVIAQLAPVLIVPLFLKMKPLEDIELRKRLEELGRRAGMRVRGVFTLELSRKSTTANAALMGLGGTRRIVLTDTLLQRYPPAGIEVILAHEMGHHRNRDIPVSLAIQSIGALIGLYIIDLAFSAAAPALGYQGISDAAALPLLMFISGGLSLIAAPLLNGYQRRRESAADDYALRLTGDAGSFIAMMTRLTDQNLAEAEPPRWVQVLMHDHPSYKERVEHARRYLAHSPSESA